MEPSYQPGPGLPTGQPDQYNFITNPIKPPKRSLFSSGGGSKSRLLILIAAGVGLLTVILLVASLLFGGSSDKQTLLNLAQKQSEVIAVASVGAEDSGTSQTQGYALAVQLAVTSEQQAVIAKLSKTEKIKEKDYASAPSTEVTTQLETAARNGRFDEVFQNVLKQELTEYQQELRTANQATSSQTTKKMLAADFDNVSLLLSIPTN